MVFQIDTDGVSERSLHQDRHGSLRFASVVQMPQPDADSCGHV